MLRLPCSAWVRLCRPNDMVDESDKVYLWDLTLHCWLLNQTTENSWGYQGAKSEAKSEASQVGCYLGSLAAWASGICSHNDLYRYSCNR